MALTQKQIDNTKPDKEGGKVRRVTDGNGLALLVHPDGKRVWMLRYRIDGKAKTLTLGNYPLIKLADANGRANDARLLIADGIDPSAKRKADKIKRRMDAENLFHLIVEEWLVSQKTWATSTAEKNRSILTNHVLPILGKTPITAIDTDLVLAVLRRIESRGAMETAYRVRELLGRIFRFARTGNRKYCAHDPVADTKGELQKKPAAEHHKALLDKGELRRFLLALDDPFSRIEPITRLALRLLALTWPRPGELRQAQWADMDLENRMWSYWVTKTDTWQYVPLSEQAIATIEALRPYSGHGRYLFPKFGKPTECMSENTLNFAIQKRMGFESTAHGFRAVASSGLNERGYNPDAIERQLSHGEKNKVRGAYNRGSYIEERTTMMQDWADYLDGLKSGAAVIPINSRVA
ncbi:MAG: integrase arm-type DNA-binding domain-containing protein [Sulfuricella denitrificans]|nr:integrase arm-type DNA-binding domain-containing protein [Sulfuricella denitrificans]